MLIVPVLGLLPITVRYDKAIDRYVNADGITGFLAISLFSGCLILALGLGGLLTYLLHKRLDRKWRLTCPHCAKSLAAYHPLTLSTRRCYHYGKRALSESAAAQTVA